MLTTRPLLSRAAALFDNVGLQGAVLWGAIVLIFHGLLGMGVGGSSLYQLVPQGLLFLLTAAALWGGGDHSLRLAASGLGLLGAATVVLIWLVMTGRTDFWTYDDPPRLLGIVLLIVCCARLMPRSRTSWLWLLGGSCLGACVVQWGFCLALGRPPWDSGLHTILLSILIVISLPAMAAVMHAAAPSGRLFWFLGLQMWWLAFMVIMALESGAATTTSASLGGLFTWASAFLCLGFLAEARRWDMGLWPYLLGVAALLVGWLVGIIQLAAAPNFVFLNFLIGGGVILFANACILMASYLSATAKFQATLQHQEADLRRATAAKDEFLGSLSHELRTPLNAIIGFAEVMADGAMGTLDELQQELVAEIRRGGERLLRLINRTLDYTKLEAGKMEQRLEPVAIASWLQGIITGHAQRARAKGLSLVLEVSADLDTWLLDRQATQKALDELLDNAIRFTADGQIRLLVTRSADGFLELQVHDSGPGIAQQHHHALFQPFEQISRDRERGVQGAGLGLALARAWIKALGGQVLHRPAPGGLFVIQLPGHVDGADQTQANRDQLVGPRQLLVERLWSPHPALVLCIPAALIGVVWLAAWSGETGGRLLYTALSAATGVLVWRAAPHRSARLVALALLLTACGYGWGVAGTLTAWPEFAQLRVVPFLAGSVFLGASFLTMRPWQRPMLVLVGFVSSVAATLYLALHPPAVHGFWLQPQGFYFMADLLCLAAALPAFEAVLLGHAPMGRLLWVGGAALLWLGDALYAASAVFAPTLYGHDSSANGMYLFGYALLGFGVVIESRRWDIGPWALILVVGSALLAWSMGTIVLRPFPQVLSYWVITGGCTIYLLALAILVAHHNRARHMTQALQQAHEEARRASADKTRFLTTMSHELRTPLNAVLGFADVLKSGDTGALEPEATEAIMEIETAGEHLLSLVEDIMDLNQIEEGVVTLDLVPVDLPTLLKNSLAIVRERAHRKGIHLELDLDPRIGSCLLDARKVKQLVFNLLSNAVKFTPDRGTVTLAAHLVSRTEVLAHQGKPGFNAQTLNDTQTFLALTVTDTGIGMAPQDLPRLFQRYSQLDAGRQQQGTGLGLSLVKSFAELHGGTVMVASEVGRGSRFGVWLGWQHGGQAGWTT